MTKRYGLTIMLYAPPVLTDAEFSLIDQIDTLRNSLRHHLAEPHRWNGTLRRETFARNLRGSNSIEGFVASLDDAAAIAASQAPWEADAPTVHALEGYRMAMTYVLQLCEDNQVGAYSTELIKALHFMMTQHDLASRPGRWRAGPVYVHDAAADRLVYTAPSLDQLDDLMNALVTDLNQGHQPALVAAAMAHLNLVMIHPFRDGNGRMARCLQSLVLGQGRPAGQRGALSPVFLSVEEYLDQHTRAYYDVLAEVGGGVWSPAADTRPWLQFMLTAHLHQAETYQRRVNNTERLWLELTKLVGDPETRVLPALADAAMGYRVTRSSYRQHLVSSGENITDQTAARDLASAARHGWLTACGEKRGRHYIANPALTSLWQQIRLET